MDFDLDTVGTASLDALRAAVTSINGELSELFASVAEDTAPTTDQAELATGLDAALSTINAELARRDEAASEFAASRERINSATAEAAEAENQTEVVTPDNEGETETTDEGAEGEGEKSESDEGTGEGEAEAEAEAENADEEKPVNKNSLRGLRPSVPGRNDRRATLSAATDVPGIATGGEIRDMEHLAELAMEKAQSFAIPTGDGTTVDNRSFGLAQIKKNIPEELKITSAMNREQVEAVFALATSEASLPGGNLSAASGWCAPSEVVYDLCEGETVEGLISLPEVGLGRGGVKYTMGPDWSDITGQGEFAMTEAQAIAGTYTKPSFEIPCPAFVESRLDAAGIFVKVPFLMEAAYPELVARWMRGIMVSHEHVMNSKYINGVVTALGAATAFPLLDMGSASTSLFDIIAFVAERERSKRRWSFTQSLEIVLPHWVLEALRADISNRTGRSTSSVKDAEISAMFTERKYAPQWVLDWQDLGSTALGYPPTFDVLIYKAGTFVKGTSDVIKVENVYDAASLASNIYTAIFMEEGWNVMRMCQGGVRATIPVCIAGRQGALNVVACGVTP